MQSLIAKHWAHSIFATLLSYQHVRGIVQWSWGGLKKNISKEADFIQIIPFIFMFCNFLAVVGSWPMS